MTPSRAPPPRPPSLITSPLGAGEPAARSVPIAARLCAVSGADLQRQSRIGFFSFELPIGGGADGAHYVALQLLRPVRQRKQLGRELGVVAARFGGFGHHAQLVRREQ